MKANAVVFTGPHLVVQVDVQKAPTFDDGWSYQVDSYV